MKSLKKRIKSGLLGGALTLQQIFEPNKKDEILLTSVDPKVDKADQEAEDLLALLQLDIDEYITHCDVQRIDIHAEENIISDFPPMACEYVGEGGLDEYVEDLGKQEDE